MVVPYTPGGYTDLMARLEHHRDRFARYERLLNKRFPQGTAPPADVGKLLGLRIGLAHERAVAVTGGGTLASTWSTDSPAMS